MSVPFPTVADVRAYISVPATAIPDGQLQIMLDACAADQASRCTVDPAAYAEPLYQALMRRVQREVAAKNLPLGMVGLEASEFAPTRLPALDAVIEEHERPYRKQVLA